MAYLDRRDADKKQGRAGKKDVEKIKRKMLQSQGRACRCSKKIKGIQRVGEMPQKLKCMLIVDGRRQSEGRLRRRISKSQRDAKNIKGMLKPGRARSRKKQSGQGRQKYQVCQYMREDGSPFPNQTARLYTFSYYSTT